MERRRPVFVIDFKAIAAYAIGAGLGYVYGRLKEREHTTKVVAENTDSLLKAWRQMLAEYVEEVLPSDRKVDA